MKNGRGALRIQFSRTDDSTANLGSYRGRDASFCDPHMSFKDSSRIDARMLMASKASKKQLK